MFLDRPMQCNGYSCNPALRALRLFYPQSKHSTCASAVSDVMFSDACWAMPAQAFFTVVCCPIRFVSEWQPSTHPTTEMSDRRGGHSHGSAANCADSATQHSLQLLAFSDFVLLTVCECSSCRRCSCCCSFSVANMDLRKQHCHPCCSSCTLT